MKSAKDLVIHFYTNTFRGSITQPKNITKAIRLRNQINDIELCEEIYASVSCSLLQSVLLRGEERVRTLAVTSKESFGLFYDVTVYTEKWGHNYLRGFASKVDSEVFSEKNHLMIGKTLYGATEEYKSIQTMQNTNKGLTESDIQHFFNVSEQVPSKLFIQSSGFSNENTSHDGLSLLIQSMPGLDNKSLNDLFTSLTNSPEFNTLYKQSINEENFKQVFKDLPHEIGYRMLEYEFKCNCNRESMLKFLTGLEVSTLSSLRKETQIITCSHCSEVYEISPEELDPLAQIDTRHEGPLTDVKYDYYGRRLATSSLDGTIKIFESDTSNSSSFSYHKGAVLGLSWSHPKFGSLLASSGADQRVFIYKETSPSKWSVIYEYLGHSAPVTCVEWAPYQYGLILLCGAMDGCVSFLVFQSEDKWENKTFFAHSNGVFGLAWKPLNSGLLLDESEELVEFVTVGADCLGKIWKFEEGEFLEQGRLERHKAWIRSVCWGQKIITAGDDGLVLEWDLTSEGSKASEVFVSKSQAFNVSVNEFGNEIAVSTSDNFTRVFRKDERSKWVVVAEVNENGAVLEHN